MNAASALLLLVLGLSFNVLEGRAADAASPLDPKKILEAIPNDLLKDIASNTNKRKEAVDAASQKLQDSYREQTVTVRFSIRSTNKSNGRYSAFAESERVRVAGTNFTVSQSVFLDESENTKGAKLKPGDKITATGKAFVSLSGSSSGNYTYLSISLNDAKLK